MEHEQRFFWENWSVTVLDTVDSTNDELKRRADAPHGTVLAARRQTRGRGRLGRSFFSPPGGLYLSVLLRPDAPPEQLLHLTAMTAVAARRAICECCALPVAIKWTNDLLCGGKKICGILTELVGGALIIGIGINANTPAQALSAELDDTASSLRALSGEAVCVRTLARALLRQLQALNGALLTQRAQWMREYAQHCVTLGKTVLVSRGGTQRAAFAEGIDEWGGLCLVYENGERETLRTGEAILRTREKSDKKQ